MVQASIPRPARLQTRALILLLLPVCLLAVLVGEDTPFVNGELQVYRGRLEPDAPLSAKISTNANETTQGDGQMTTLTPQAPASGPNAQDSQGDISDAEEETSSPSAASPTIGTTGTSAPTTSPLTTPSDTTKTPPIAAIKVQSSARMCGEISLSASGSRSTLPDQPELTYTWEIIEPPSLSFSSFLDTQQGEEVTIPTKTVYQAATDYLLKNPTAQSGTFTFRVTVRDGKGSTAKAEGKSTVVLALTPPNISFDSPAKITVKNHESLDLTVTPQYCPHVVTNYDPGVAFQWSATCPDDSRTADQLLFLGTDGSSASLRPYSLTPGYTYRIGVTIRYTSNAGLSGSTSIDIQVEREILYIRFQFLLSQLIEAEEYRQADLPKPVLLAEENDSGTQTTSVENALLPILEAPERPK